jgi:hypothetical protein
MGKIIATEGIEWATIFTEDIALGLLTEHGSNAWCEKLWIDDYIAQKGKLLL